MILQKQTVRVRADFFVAELAKSIGFPEENRFF